MNDTYDVVIIGAGIGGLVCGCYLAKNRKKVLILEKNDHPGGCCTSFSKNGFQFDSAAHSLGGMSKKGPIGQVLEDLEISVPLRRVDPSYILQVADYKLNIWNTFENTIRQLKKDFYDEHKMIEEFFQFILTASSQHVFLS